MKQEGWLNMENRVDRAVECFNNGFDCSQAILSVFGEGLIDKETALKISCGLAVGVARTNRTCGAVSGAYLVIGLMHGRCRVEDAESKERTFEMIREFDRRFAERNGSLNCFELLGVDLCTGDKELAKRQVKRICPGLVRDAAEILEGML
jgi:C_GCAxxG_C_C family probable redox protein